MANAEPSVRPNRDRFGCVPVFWLPLIRSLHELKVACALMGRADATGASRASFSQLSSDTGIDLRSVRRAVGQLEAKGLASRTEIGAGRRASTYQMKLSVRSEAEPTALSVRTGAQSNGSVRWHAQAASSQHARISHSACAPERSLDSVPKRIHTENRIITDPARAHARDEDTSGEGVVANERSDAERAAFERFREDCRRRGFMPDNSLRLRA